MSRNKEKAQSALNRFQTYKNQQAGVLESNPQLRPKYVQSVESLAQAEKWRSVVLSEISVRLTRIQDPSSSDFLIRELNEELNKLFREKRAWEYHVKSLGGNDYLLSGNLNSTGLLVPNDPSGIKGYRYFGRAKELPDVKRLLEAESNAKAGKKNEKLLKQTKETKTKEREDRLDLDYYGLNDETWVKQDLFTAGDLDKIKEISRMFNESFTVEEPAEEFQNESELLQFEKQRSTQLLLKIKSESGPKETSEEILDFADVVPKHSDVSKWLVNRKKKELLERLGLQA